MSRWRVRAIAQRQPAMLQAGRVIAGLGAIALALEGQRSMHDVPSALVATRWYLGAILLTVLAWAGTYRNQSLACETARESDVASVRPPAPARRCLLAGVGWFASLAILALAFVRYPGGATPLEPAKPSSLPRWLEIGLVAGIVLLAAGFRLYRLGDWTTGMHGDEGEAGMDALAILNGHPVSPFLTGWF